MQKRVALSTAEAEYRAATLAGKEIAWLRGLLLELGQVQTTPTPMYEDNRACILMVENPIVSGRNKHIEIDCHFIRGLYKRGEVKLIAIGTKQQRADIMTKNLPGPLFLIHSSTLVLNRGRSMDDELHVRGGLSTC